MERDKALKRLQTRFCEFQLTRSRGAWPKLFFLVRVQRHFNSHAHVERDEQLIYSRLACWFQLTRSRGAWPPNLLRVLKPGNFNSHAHVERDFRQSVYFARIEISTHTLTWSVTVQLWICRLRAHISTHTLTWSVTISPLGRPARRKFQLTRSRGAWPTLVLIILQVFAFQLTRSRGAWLVSLIKLSDLSNFNSHAHVERDELLYHLQIQTDISTHTLTWSVTLSNGQFNSSVYISTHTLTWSVTRSRSLLGVLPSISTHTLTWSVTLQVSPTKQLPCISTHTLTWSVTLIWI